MTRGGSYAEAGGNSEKGSMTESARRIIETIRSLVPEYLAEPWDQVGLQVGAADAPVRGILVTLDVTPQVLQEAEVRGAQFILSHHPVIFAPLTSVTSEDTVGSLVARAVRQNVVIYVAHTNLDSVAGGVNDALADALGLENTVPLLPAPGVKRYKLVTFVPPDHLDDVRAALCTAGAGIIGEYSCCSFTGPGEGTFLPSHQAQPAVGETGRLNRVEELRLEMVVEAGWLGAAVQALLAAHPYEEAAYDIYPLEQVGGAGLGRLGTLPEETTLGALADACRVRLGATLVKVSGGPQSSVETVAVCGGSGKDLVEAAWRAGADVFVAGEIGHHRALEAKQMGLSLIEAGHYYTEQVALEPLAAMLSARIAGEGLEVEVAVARTITEPWEA